MGVAEARVREEYAYVRQINLRSAFVTPIVDTSIYVSAAAVLVAILALVLGEARAAAVRRDKNERNDVSWSISWVSPDELRLESRAPDSARKVRARIKIGGHFASAVAQRVDQRESIGLDVPFLSVTWKDLSGPRHYFDDETMARPRPIGGVACAVHVSWVSRRNQPHETEWVESNLIPAIYEAGHQPGG
jgi:hypothetical protein